MTSQKLKRTYKFALKTAFYVTILLTLFVSVFLYFNSSEGSDWIYLLAFALVCFTLSFVITQYRVERFIYKRVKKIYDDLTLLESTSLRNQPITTDMGTLTKEIDIGLTRILFRFYISFQCKQSRITTIGSSLCNLCNQHNLDFCHSIKKYNGIACDVEFNPLKLPFSQNFEL